jgi:putative aldouronate transport system substrate-binding protein
MKKNRLLSILLAGATCLPLLAGCAKTTSAQSAAGTASAAASAAASSAAVSKPQGDPVKITWLVRGDEPKNSASVFEAVNKKLKADLNTTLTMKFIAAGDYNTKMQMAMAGGEDWDLCYTASWANNYVSAAGKGAYLELTTDMLKKDAPHVMSTIPENLWDGIKVSGKIYALMNYQVMYEQPGLQFLKSVIDEQKIDVKTITNWASLDAVFAKLAAAYPDCYAFRGNLAQTAFFRETPISCVMDLPFLCYDPSTKKLSNTKYFDDFAEYYKYAKQWKDKGYIPADAATLQDEATMIKQGKILSRYCRIKPGVESDLKSTNGLDWVCISTGKGVIGTSSAQSTLTAVSVNSAHPEEAIRLYDYIFGSKEVSNMLFYGVEGTDYTLENNRVVRKADGYNFNSAWMIGNQFNALLLPGKDDDVWVQTMKGNKDAMTDALFGFVPDRTPVETELATCESIWGEYKDILNFGLDDSATVIPEMMDKLKKAGMEKVTTEMQKQLDTFFASKK